MLRKIDDILNIKEAKKKAHILAFRSAYVDAILTKEGIDTDCSHALVETVDLSNDFPPESVFFVMRDVLECVPYFRHPIFYITLEHKGKIAVYKRLSAGGESRLHNVHSIGFGGHVDFSDTIHENSIVDAEQSIIDSSLRELSEELSLPFDVNTAEIKTRGYIIDNRDEVGQVHLGVWQSLIVPDDVDISLIDVADDERDKIEFLGFKDIDWYNKNLNNKSLILEGWSEMIINR
jgi:predicted NUDIX family phosphoesterase